MKELDSSSPKEPSGFHEGSDFVSNNTHKFTDKVRRILLAQPLNEIEPLEFEVFPRKRAVHQTG